MSWRRGCLFSVSCLLVSMFVVGLWQVEEVLRSMENGWNYHLFLWDVGNWYWFWWSFWAIWLFIVYFINSISIYILLVMEDD